MPSFSDLAPELQPFAQYLLDAAGAAGLMPRVTSTRRSHAEQTRLYRRSLAGQQPFPVARPGTSAHEYGFAFDMVVSPMSALPEVGAFWEQLGGVWGGRFQSSAGGRLKGQAAYDPVHFEYPGWHQLVDWSQPDQRAQRDFPSIGEIALDVFTPPQFQTAEGSSASVGERIVQGFEDLYGFLTGQ